MFYCDTSLLLAALTEEVHTEAAAGWLARQEQDTLAASEWLTTELASGLARKRQRRELTEIDTRRISQSWHAVRDLSFKMFPVLVTDFIQAAALIEQVGVPLRAGDALHLALASTHRLGIATLDNMMAAAAVELGLPVAGVLASD